MQVVGRFYFVCVGWGGHSFKRHRVDNGSLINIQRPLGHVAHEVRGNCCLLRSCTQAYTFYMWDLPVGCPVQHTAQVIARSCLQCWRQRGGWFYLPGWGAGKEVQMLVEPECFQSSQKIHLALLCFMFCFSRRRKKECHYNRLHYMVICCGFLCKLCNCKHLGLRNINQKKPPKKPTKKKKSFFLIKALRKGLVHLSGVTLPWE